MRKIPSFSDSKSVYFWVSPSLLINKKCESHIRRETASENIHFKEKNGYVISTYSWKKVVGYHCTSGIVIFAWRITWNYAYSPFKVFHFIKECLDIKGSIYLDKMDIIDGLKCYIHHNIDILLKHRRNRTYTWWYSKQRIQC